MNKQAFSLVELSIVLVILGLLTGGILAGQSLIRASELRALTSEYTRYATAGRAFRDKYFAIPGDMTNATLFWGTDAGGCPGTNATAPNPGIPTCNGDGNGSLVYNAVGSNEVYRFWQQLADAGLIEGSYTGVSNSTTAASVVDSTSTANVPKSKLNSAHWGVYFGGAKTISDTTFFDGYIDTNIFFASTGATNYSPMLKPEEAWNIDTKLDDGKPGTGSVQSVKNAQQANSATGCSDQNYSTTVSIATNSNYLLSNSTMVCSLILKAGF